MTVFEAQFLAQFPLLDSRRLSVHEAYNKFQSTVFCFSQMCALVIDRLHYCKGFILQMDFLCSSLVKLINIDRITFL